MKTVSLSLAAVLATLALAQTPSFAGNAGPSVTSDSQVVTISAARKQRSPFVKYVDPYTGEVMTVYRKDYYVPSNDFEGGYFPGSYAVHKSDGRCVQDLGYGRYKLCN
jgi:hypothetical protein